MVEMRTRKNKETILELDGKTKEMNRQVRALEAVDPILVMEETHRIKLQFFNSLYFIVMGSLFTVVLDGSSFCMEEKNAFTHKNAHLRTVQLGKSLLAFYPSE